MELAGEWDGALDGHSAGRRTGTARSQRENSRAFTRNEGMPPRSARDFGFLEGTRGGSACAAYRRGGRALQRTRGERACGRTLPHDMLKACGELFYQPGFSSRILSDSSETSRSRLSGRTSISVTSGRDLIASVNGRGRAKIVASSGTSLSSASFTAS